MELSCQARPVLCGVQDILYTFQAIWLKDTGQDTSTAHTDDGPTDGQRAGRKRSGRECGYEIEQERSHIGGRAVIADTLANKIVTP